ncbi:MAG: heme-binding protein [Gammaproteobacteria bacterium]|nr:heme-binding protein [Gammaproteobacteria bacterium]
MKKLISILLVLVSSNALSALPKQAVLPAELAHKAVIAAVDQCRKNGYTVSAAIVDVSGVLRAQLRADSAGAHTLDSSFKKAYTSASLKDSTQNLANLIHKKPELQTLRDMNNSILLLGGGLPIVMDNEVVGGIGVGGAPGAHLDEACAKAALQAIGAVIESEK